MNNNNLSIDIYRILSLEEDFANCSKILNRMSVVKKGKLIDFLSKMKDPLSWADLADAATTSDYTFYNEIESLEQEYVELFINSQELKNILFIIQPESLIDMNLWSSRSIDLWIQFILGRLLPPNQLQIDPSNSWSLDGYYRLNHANLTKYLSNYANRKQIRLLCHELRQMQLYLKYQPKLLENKHANPTKSRNQRKRLFFWQFLIYTLKNPQTFGQIILWIDSNEGLFQVKNDDELTKLWCSYRDVTNSLENVARYFRNYIKNGYLIANRNRTTSKQYTWNLNHAAIKQFLLNYDENIMRKMYTNSDK